MIRTYVEINFDGVQEKQWKLDKRKGYFQDPQGKTFQWGFEDKGDIPLLYSRPRTKKYMKKEDAEKLIQIINENTDKENRIEKLHSMYKPGSLPYFFIKQETLLGKKRKH